MAERIEFFFDPVCPWAWITSRFAVEVSEQTGLPIDWRFICLRMVNDVKDYSTFPPGYANVHGAGRSFLRVAAAARAEAGNDGVGRLYTALGTALHNNGRGAEVRESGDVSGVLADALATAGLPATLAQAADDESFDAVLHEETDLALSRTGKDVGTPIITYDPGTDHEQSFFGPVISRIPRGDEAIEVWAAVERLARTPGLAEVKRSLRSRPQFD
jgi:2-hydroxychromene-2-carboxylate isomerase